jgi:hypothetical protein
VYVLVYGVSATLPKVRIVSFDRPFFLARPSLSRRRELDVIANKRNQFIVV